MEKKYYLDCLYLHTIQGTSYSASQLLAIIEQRVPCGSFGVIERETGLSPQGTLGRGSYIKRGDAACFIEIVSEQGTCVGLLASLFPDRPVRALAASR